MSISGDSYTQEELTAVDGQAALGLQQSEAFPGVCQLLETATHKKNLLL